MRVAHELATVLDSPGISAVIRDFRSDYALLDDLTGDARLEILYDYEAGEETAAVGGPEASVAGGGEEGNADERMKIELMQDGDRKPQGAWPIGPGA